MQSRTPLAHTLAFAGGLVLLAVPAFMLVGATLSFAWSLGGFGLDGGFDPMMLVFAIIALLGAACGIALLVAAPRLRHDDAAVRQRAATWAIVAGAVGLVTGFGLGVIGGGLGLAAGILTMTDAPRTVGA